MLLRSMPILPRIALVELVACDSRFEVERVHLINASRRQDENNMTFPSCSPHAHIARWPPRMTDLSCRAHVGAAGHA